ncbi:MAG: ABC transporter ATP-binding protein [Elusimicrobiales bacterium]
MLDVENLTKIFDKKVAVDNLSIKVNDGEIFALLGPNGAGKTTTVKIISGLLKPTSGKITLCGIDVVKQPIKAKRMISFIPDEPFVYPYLTGREFLSFICEIYGVEDYSKKIDEVAEYFELYDSIDMLLSSYSYGMRQKLLIASAVLRKPRLMIFDEPTVGLDPISVKKFKTYLKKLKDEGTSVFLCTHILEMAEKLCDRVCVLKKGRIVLSGSVKNILENKDKNLEDVFFEVVQS